jgi:hypothetical protein
MIDFTDFALLMNAKSFISINQLKTKLKQYTVEGLRKRLNHLCKQGLMESLVVKNKTFYRTTTKGVQTALAYYKENLEEFKKKLENS